MILFIAGFIVGLTVGGFSFLLDWPGGVFPPFYPPGRGGCV
jgi:hypothetical protein